MTTITITLDLPSHAPLRELKEFADRLGGQLRYLGEGQYRIALGGQDHATRLTSDGKIVALRNRRPRPIPTPPSAA